MKTTFLIITCLFSIISTGSSQYYYGIVWEKCLAPEVGVPEEYMSTRFELNCMDCLDKNNCIITGIVNKFPDDQFPPEPPYQRITFRTTDGGHTWKKGTLSPDLEVKYNTSSKSATPRIISLFMVDSLIAIAVGGDSSIMIRTTDGGMTWYRIYNVMSTDPKRQFYSISFTPDRKTGMVVGSNGIVSISTDKGETWNTEELRHGIVTVNTLAISPANEVFYVFDGIYTKMFRTFDSGKTWDTLTVYKHWYNSKPIVTGDSDIQGTVITAHFLTPAIGWVAAVERHKENTFMDKYKVLLQTIDSGRTWTLRKSDFTGRDDYYNTIAFADGESGMIGGGFGLSLFSADSGFSWYEGQRFLPYNNPSIIMARYKEPDAGLALVANYAVGQSAIYRFRRAPLSVEEVQGWGSNPYFWIQTAPCPAVSTVHARLFGLYSIKTREVTAKVYDMMGNVVYDASREASDGNNGTWSDLTFSVEGWAPGVYLLGMQAEGAGFARAFVVGR